MKWIERIVVAVDDTPCSLTALSYAARLAAGLHAEVLVLHVDRPQGRPWSQAVLLAGGVGSDLLRTLNARPGDSMEELLASLGRSALVRANARSPSSPAKAILGVARRYGADLLVLGTHPRTRIGRWLNPSVAEQVVRQAPCPALVVHLKDAYLCAIRSRERHGRALDDAGVALSLRA